MSASSLPSRTNERDAAPAEADACAVTLDDIEAEIARGGRRLAFPMAIEKAFENDGLDQRVTMMVRTGLIALVLYDLFLINDWLALRDMFPAMVVARLGIFTPALLLIIVVAHSRRSYRLRETLAVVGAVLAVVLPMTVMIFSESPRMLSYQYGSLLVMMFATVVQRVRFRFAVIGLGLMLAVQAIATYASGAFDAETYQTIVIVFATAAALFSATAYYLEQADRRQFLLARRGELLREELARSARTDALTGLFNRRHLGDVTEAIWAPAAGDARIVSAILIDIDHFKRFNDSRGHLEGDTCLRRLSACIARVAQEQQGLAFRYGGEEMLVLLPDVELGEACATARAIHEAIRATAIPHPALGEAATVGASLGVAGAFIATTTASALIAAADTALYAAKRAGRNQVWPPLGLAPMQREAVEASHAALRQTG